MPLIASQLALVLAPHPDDESAGCGGTIRLITSNRGIVDVLYLTRGDQGFFPGEHRTEADRAALAAKRQDEALEACRVLGVRQATFLEGKDGQLQSQPYLAADIARVLQAQPYRSVFCPWPGETHPDHAAASDMLQTVLSDRPGDVNLWLYEVSTPCPHNICISIDATFEVKMQALRSHQSQVSILSYLPAFEGLALYRSLWCPPARYAEAFINCDRHGFQAQWRSNRQRRN